MRWSTDTSSSGLESTAITSADLPDAIVPTSSETSSSLAALTVAALIASRERIPASTMKPNSRAFCPWGPTPMSVRSRCGAVGSLPGRRFDGHRPGERGVEFLDRPAACFDADEEKTDNGEQIPGGKVVESGYERVKRRLRSDIVGGAGDDRQAV